MNGFKGTPGPWAWIDDGRGNPVLATPDRGRLYVMQAVRKGMQGANVRFSNWNGILDGAKRERMGGIMREGVYIDGTDIMHPDAAVIEAAPELLALAERLAEFLAGKPYPIALKQDARALVARIKGGS